MAHGEVLALSGHPADPEAERLAPSTGSETGEYQGETQWMQSGNLVSWVIGAFAIVVSLFHMYTALRGPLIAYQQRMIHLSALLALGAMTYPLLRGRRDRGRLLWVDVGVALLVLVPPLYVFLNYESLLMRFGSPTTVDIAVGSLYIVLVLELTRRTVGWPLFLVASASILFALFGGSLPGVLGHRGFGIRRLVDHLFSGTEGVLGIPIGVSASFVFMFVLFGAFLDASGGGKFFIDVSRALVGGRRGGPAKTAVVASALMGTLTGSSMANVVTTGTFTIPLMAKTGYRPHFAGAVEAAASTGGQLMPPVMGAAAFVMMEYLGIPYSRIMLAGILPALLYFWGVYVSVDLEAKRLQLSGDVEGLPKLASIVRSQGWVVLPMVVMVGSLFYGYTPGRAGGLATVALAFLMAIQVRGVAWLRTLASALRQGALSMIPVATACASAGIIAGVLTLTGTGLKLAGLIESLSGGNLGVALVLTMITCLILGMGLPTTANYIVVATVAAPALTRMGLPVLVAHMFVFFFGVLADVTPPVALAAYAAAGIAKANQMKTAFTAFTIALVGFLAPYVFAYSPELLLIGVGSAASVAHLGLVIVTSVAGIWMLGGALRGHWISHAALYERAVLLIGAGLLIKPGWLTDVAGLGLGVLVAALQLTRQARGGPTAFDHGGQA